MCNSKITANNWRMLYATYPGKEHANKHLAAIQKMTLFGAQALDCFPSISKEQDLFILSLTQNKKELQVFHQPTNLGGLLDDPLNHFVTLLSMGPEANPVEIDVASIQDFELLMPTWVACSGAEGDAEVFKQIQTPEEPNKSNTLKGKNMSAFLLFWWRLS